MSAPIQISAERVQAIGFDRRRYTQAAARAYLRRAQISGGHFQPSPGVWLYVVASPSRFGRLRVREAPGLFVVEGPPKRRHRR